MSFFSPSQLFTTHHVSILARFVMDDLQGYYCKTFSRLFCKSVHDIMTKDGGFNQDHF